jgi:uncharacterized protein (DUF1499 family)
MTRTGRHISSWPAAITTDGSGQFSTDNKGITNRLSFERRTCISDTTCRRRVPGLIDYLAVNYTSRAMANRSANSRLCAAGLILLLMNTPVVPAAGVSSLPACPDKPNCVSSQAHDPAHSIDPFTFSGSVQDALHRLKMALATEKRLTILTEHGNYLHAEARSLLFRFVDDVEFLFEPEHKLIHVRSASRSGYSDLGVNRRRVERIRQAFMQAQ